MTAIGAGHVQCEKRPEAVRKLSEIMPVCKIQSHV